MRPADQADPDRVAMAREIGAIGPSGGAALVVIAGLHGNEPAGVVACHRVLSRLPAAVMRGRFVAIRGNVAALEQGRRFVDADLNRHWLPSRVAALRAGAEHAGTEDAELVGLGNALDAAAERAPGARYVLDLHTTSAPSAPFALVADGPGQRALAGSLGVPSVFGLEARLEGTLLAWLARRGWVGIGVEGGRHDDPESIDRLEAVVWLMLAATGLVDEAAVPDIGALRRRLEAACVGLPAAVEVRYRHAISPSDAFRMRRGFVNFQPVTSGEAVATDRHGLVRAPETGHILMPLYQGLGDEGFFLARPVPGGDARKASRHG